ncbi:hypothetical protein APX01_03300 [Cereibacter sphaeroides]|jgi:hypothetical protein|nr:hypothetical protein APX01_03300 [Cereibacter sphaeroides]ANS33306.1 hypothetical protein A3858_03310 [Cereibacter sphaeroides]ATN62349.1 hypothetical protein A3857_03305 [Cereibacter sphaeroides]AXC60454.1 hypothetical protein DQL45_03435 [Cereibacter sphaeroides 2.4.1]
MLDISSIVNLLMDETSSYLRSAAYVGSREVIDELKWPQRQVGKPWPWSGRTQRRQKWPRVALAVIV